MNIFGVGLGLAGMLTIVPALSGSLVMVFGPGMVVWSIWLGIVLLRRKSAAAPGRRRLSHRTAQRRRWGVSLKTVLRTSCGQSRAKKFDFSEKSNFWAGFATNSTATSRRHIMKAIITTEYGSPDVLQLRDVPTPAPKDGEVLIKVHAASVSYGDLLARNFKNVTSREFNMPLPLLLPTRVAFGWSKPKINILGSEFAGEVTAVGSGVTRFKPGDAVMGYLGQRMGAYAEYVCIAETGMLAIKPANISNAEAATVPYGALMATSLLRRANIQPGHQVLINGASGGIGSAAVQLAKHHGAEVTGVCGAARAAYVKALGADHVINYAAEDFTRNGQRYDVIFDVLGKSSFARCRDSLAPDGIYLLASFKTKALLQMLRSKVASSQKVICALADEKAENLVLVGKLVESGQYRAIVDRCFPLEQAAEAHRYVEAGSRTGPVVLVVDQNRRS